METPLLVSDRMTVEACRDRALARGFPLFSLENGDQCWGGSDLERATKDGGALTGCTKPCKGNSSQICGELGFMSLYRTEGGMFG